MSENKAYFLVVLVVLVALVCVKVLNVYESVEQAEIRSQSVTCEWEETSHDGPEVVFTVTCEMPPGE